MMKECVSSIQEFLSYHVARNNYNYKTEHVYFKHKTNSNEKTEIFNKNNYPTKSIETKLYSIPVMKISHGVHYKFSSLRCSNEA